MPRPTREGARHDKKTDALHLLASFAMIVATVLLACAAAALAVSEKETFSGKNCKVAHASYDGTNHEIYTVNLGVGGAFQITNSTDDLDKG